MESGGRATHKGLNAQDWAAISLFLQYFPYQNLEYIAFEQLKLKDFNLSFTSKKKIICESKSFEITYSHVRDILKDINPLDVQKNDEILIICEKVKEDVKQDLEYYKYFDPIKDKLRKKGFEDKHFHLLPHLQFWEVSKVANEKIALDLLSKILGIWVPEDELKDILNSIVLQRVYFGSEAGTKLTKEEFQKELEGRKSRIKNRSGYYTEEESKIKQIETAIEALKYPENHRDWSITALSSLTGSPNIHYLTIKRLKEQKDLDLTKWDSLWQASATGAFALEVMDIFKQNAHLKDNQKYLIKFLPTVTNRIVDLFHDRFYGVDVVKICQKILSETSDYNKEIFNIIKQVLDRDTDKYLYIKNKGNQDHKQWEQEEITKVLQDLYFKSESKKLKQEIIDYVLKKFKLVEDDSEFWHDTPPEIFAILKSYTEEIPEQRILELSKKFSEQFQASYSKFGKSNGYRGWELSSGMDDRHFITLVLQPILTEYHIKNPEKAWSFLVKYCVNLDEKKISASQPDFMNRIGLKVLLKEYEGGKHKDESFKILSGLIKMRGLPTKAELVFNLLKNTLISDEGKWNLLKVQLDHPPYKGLPLDPTEEIVSELAQKGFDPALKQLEVWANSKEYNNRKHPFDSNVIDSLLPILKTESKAIQTLKNYIDSDFFKNDLGKFKVWDVAKVLTELLRVNYTEGKSILLKISTRKNITKNEQALLTSVLTNINQDETELIEKVYGDIVQMWFDESRDNIRELQKIFISWEERESIVGFGEKLARVGSYEPAFRIAKLFINDPEPTLTSPDKDSSWHKEVQEGGNPQSIHSVRTRVCYLLELMVGLNGRKYIPQIISLVKQLLNDKNYYVRAHACAPLEQLMRIRNTYLPGTKYERFINIDLAEEIEKITWELVSNKENYKLLLVMKGVAQVIGCFRNLSEQGVIRLFKTVLATGNNEFIEDCIQVFLYYAEFRKEIFKDEKFKFINGEKKWKELNQYNGEDFKRLFIQFIKDKKTDPKIRVQLAWLLRKLPKEEGVNFDKCFDIAVEYFSYLLSEYNKDVSNNIYHFIDDNLNKKYKQCIKLWKECLTQEKSYLEANLPKEQQSELAWAPYYFNGKILALIGQKEGDQEFAKWFEHLVTYPELAIIGHDIGVAVDHLLTLHTTEKNKELFEKIVTRFPEYYDKRQNWLKN